MSARSLEGKRISADHDELNAMGNQGSDELVEVGRELHRFASGGIRPRPPAPPEAAIASTATPAASALRRQTRSGARFAAAQAASAFSSFQSSSVRRRQGQSAGQRRRDRTSPAHCSGWRRELRPVVRRSARDRGRTISSSHMCYTAVMSRHITQRELRNESGRIMRALDKGEVFTITRNGVPVGELTPVRPRAFVTADAVTAVYRRAPRIARTRFRRDVDFPINQDPIPRG